MFRPEILACLAHVSAPETVSIMIKCVAHVFKQTSPFLVQKHVKPHHTTMQHYASGIIYRDNLRRVYIACLLPTCCYIIRRRSDRRPTDPALEAAQGQVRCSSHSAWPACRTASATCQAPAAGSWTRTAEPTHIASRAPRTENRVETATMGGPMPCEHFGPRRSSPFEAAHLFRVLRGARFWASECAKPGACHSTWQAL